MLKETSGALILSRLIGHQELEPLNRPLFNPQKVEDARFQLAEAERIRKEIEMYGGVLGGTNNEPKPAAESEEEVDDGVSSNNVLGRSTMM